MIRIIGQVPPVLIGYSKPHKPKYSLKEKSRQVSIDVRKNQIYVYEQDECLYKRENDEEIDQSN
jgi:hypothetical protein